MIRFIRDKWRGSLARKYRKIANELALLGLEEKRIAKRKKKLAAQLVIVGSIAGMKNKES